MLCKNTNQICNIGKIICLHWTVLNVFCVLFVQWRIFPLVQFSSYALHVSVPKYVSLRKEREITHTLSEQMNKSKSIYPNRKISDLQALYLCKTYCHKTDTRPLAVLSLENQLYLYFLQVTSLINVSLKYSKKPLPNAFLYLVFGVSSINR